MSRFAVMLLAVVFLPQVTGCIILPLPPLGAQIGREDIETLKPGLVKREQIHEALGNPDTKVTDRYEIFDVGEERFNLFWLVALPPAPGGDFVRIGRRSYRVLAEYGADDVLRDLQWEGSDEVPSKEPLPSSTWPDWKWGLVNASPDGHLLLKISRHDPFFGSPTFAIELHDGWTGAPIAKVDAIPGCKSLKTDMRSDIWSSPVTVFLSDSKHLASIAGRDTLCIWNAETERRVLELFVGEELRALSAARSAPIVAAVDAGNKIITIWNGLTGAEINTIAPCSPKNFCRNLRMALSDDGRLLVTLQDSWARPEGRWLYKRARYGVRLWDVESGAELAAIELKNAPDLNPDTHSIAVSSDPRRVAVHFGDHVEIWRITETTGPAWQEGKDIAQTTPWATELELVQIMPPIDDRVYSSLAFSADGRKLAAGDSFAIVWEVGTWREIWRAPSVGGIGFIFTADGRRIITSNFSWDVPELDESRHIAAPPS